MSWTELQADIQKCNACKLRASCTQVIAGEGNTDARVLFISEGPDEKEDETGTPFSGYSGKFLHGEIRRRGIPDEDTFTTNVVRCYPPDGRDPEPEEIDACWQWTEKILALVKPKIIVTLGKYPLSALAYRYGFSKKLGSQIKITTIAGRSIWVEDKHFYVYPMYHPSFATRSRVRREEFAGHMRFLATSLPGWLERP
ncbi:MAG: uracil-DNA glycosylase [Archaeoglobales archaeon]|nr:MAG: uracil-DNA glycosylase [Archaeoglobales archaeon]